MKMSKKEILTFNKKRLNYLIELKSIYSGIKTKIEYSCNKETDLKSFLTKVYSSYEIVFIKQI